MEDKVLWVNEGFVLDEAGNMITTSYVDLRDPGCRTPIRGLVKGCKREHALEYSETLLISPLPRFREEGPGLIHDTQEGLAQETTVVQQAQTLADAAKQRALAELREANDIAGGTVRMELSETCSKTSKTTKSLSFGNEWWLFSTSIAPETEEEWKAWKASLDPDYDHVSTIGQPAKFAHALARMVTETLGPQGKDGWITAPTREGQESKTKHNHQCVIHGPVIYTGEVLASLTRDMTEERKFAALMFTKSASHTDQREYRFVILKEGTLEGAVLLDISGMMRDALKSANGGLIRPAGAPAGGDDRAQATAGLRVTTTPRDRRKTAKKTVTKREEHRLETRGPDGEIVSSNSKRRETTRERKITWDLDLEDGEPTVETYTNAEGQARTEEVPQLQEEDSVRRMDEEAAHEIALEQSENSGVGDGTKDTIPVVHSGTGRTYASIEEMLADPATPMGPAKEPWAESALAPEEILKIYGLVATLALKINEVSIENRKDAASACWHAMQCVRNVYARLGDVVDSVWIERQRFAVIQMKESEGVKANGRVVVGPSGGYAYAFSQLGSQQLGLGEGHLGSMFFPMGTEMEMFESFGWSSKEVGPEKDDDHNVQQ